MPSNLKNVLLITYYFPPSGGAGVQRTLKYVKYLSSFGYRPIVLTVENGHYDVLDETLFADIPPECKVYRTKIFEPHNLYKKFTQKNDSQTFSARTSITSSNSKSFKEKFSAWVRRNFFIPDSRIGWIPSAMKAAQEIIKKENIQCIYTSSSPYTCAVIGWRLKKKMGIPWVHCLRDPWTDHLTTVRRRGLAHYLDRYFERKAYEDCDVFEYAWQGILDDISTKYPHVPTTKSVWIPNGYDESDYIIDNEIIDEKYHIIPQKDKLVFCYTGILYEGNSPFTFIDAISELYTSHQISLDKFVLKFIGTFNQTIEAYFRSSPIADAIEIHPYKPHKESVAHLLSSDILLSFTEHRFVPGKFFEYLGTKKPIFAISNSSDLNALIEETQSGKYAKFEDKNHIQHIFLMWYNEFLNQKYITSTHKGIEKYSRKNCTKTVANIFNQIIKNREY